eukprot:m.34358 g.34358  ORF g.34358 m.34358 type:complete len:973 (-) comp16966_c0_seq1:140-3058(-)
MACTRSAVQLCILVLVSLTSRNNGCVFHCNTSVCGGTPVVFVRYGFKLGVNSKHGYFLTNTTFENTLDLSNRGIVSIAHNGLACYFEEDPIQFADDDDEIFHADRTQAILLDNNLLTIAPDFSLFNSTPVISFRNNTITSLAGLRKFDGSFLYVDFRDNLIESLPDEAFTGFDSASGFLILLNRNRMTSVGRVFSGYTGGGNTYIDMSENDLNETSLKRVVQSFEGSTGTLNVVMQHNQIEAVPENLFRGVALRTHVGDYNSVSLDLSYNPIKVIDVAWLNATSWMKTVEVTMNYPTTGPIRFPSSYILESIYWDPTTGGALSLGLVATGVDISVVAAFAGLTAETLTLDLRHNNFTSIRPEVFYDSRATSLDLSNNKITMISPEAFKYTFHLNSLDLSNNSISTIPIELLSNNPALTYFNIANNSVWAIPLRSNHIQSQLQAHGNILECDSYGPSLLNCQCSDGYVYSTHCEYGRCMTTENGCHTVDADRIFSNTTNCTAAPFSQCLTNCPNQQYYDTVAEACIVATQCDTTFQDRGSTEYLAAYEVYPLTNYTDRVCSICSTCPNGYHTTPCTTTTNAQCTRQAHLTSGDIASIVLTVFLLVTSTLVGVVYGRTQSTKRNMTQGELEMTELLLGDVTQEKDRINEEKTRMQQAWVIDESDLKMYDVIGVGAYGTVFAGTWGHIPVAVKVLRTPIDDVDPLITDDFNREVTFMQSIRHPNIITFYGAGINTNHRAYLVTELMEGGSLWKLLQDKAQDVSWHQRIAFTKDIARGTRYLHDQGTIHRDLKADNCFVDTNMNVKVADFGTGKIQTRFETSSNTNTRSSDGDELSYASDGGATPAADVRKTLKTTTGVVGSPLWMAPELLLSRSGDDSAAPPELESAVDVFSFGMVMFEIWVREFPWSEIKADDITFLSELEEAIKRGDRPQVPSSCATVAPGGFVTLMHQCWSTAPQHRPTFAMILDRLSQITL